MAIHHHPLPKFPKLTSISGPLSSPAARRCFWATRNIPAARPQSRGLNFRRVGCIIPAAGLLTLLQMLLWPARTRRHWNGAPQACRRRHLNPWPQDQVGCNEMGLEFWSVRPLCYPWPRDRSTIRLYSCYTLSCCGPTGSSRRTSEAENRDCCSGKR